MFPGFRCEPCPTGLTDGDYAKGYKANSLLHVKNQTCNDVDECSYGLARCGFNAVCRNTIASYECDCSSGFEKISKINVDFKSQNCEDINECKKNPNICSGSSKCKNRPGSYECQCKKGYVASRHNKTNPMCKDINECASGTHFCHAKSHCVNIRGAYYCDCDPGYMRYQNSFSKKFPLCMDIDECSCGG